MRKSVRDVPHVKSDWRNPPHTIEHECQFIDGLGDHTEWWRGKPSRKNLLYGYLHGLELRDGWTEEQKEILRARVAINLRTCP